MVLCFIFDFLLLVYPILAIALGLLGGYIMFDRPARKDINYPMAVGFMEQDPKFAEYFMEKKVQIFFVMGSTTDFKGKIRVDFHFFCFGGFSKLATYAVYFENDGVGPELKLEKPPIFQNMDDFTRELGLFKGKNGEILDLKARTFHFYTRIVMVIITMFASTTLPWYLIAPETKWGYLGFFIAANITGRIVWKILLKIHLSFM